LANLYQGSFRVNSGRYEKYHVRCQNKYANPYNGQFICTFSVGGWYTCGGGGGPGAEAVLGGGVRVGRVVVRGRRFGARAQLGALARRGGGSRRRRGRRRPRGPQLQALRLALVHLLVAVPTEQLVHRARRVLLQHKHRRKQKLAGVGSTGNGRLANRKQTT